MEPMKRYAVFYAPRPGAFADAAAHWLGWDAQAGRTLPGPDLPDLPATLAELTAEPRRYGFHGTIRAPFRPAAGLTGAAIAQSVAALAAGLAPVVCEGLRLEELDSFLALIPEGGAAALIALGAAVITGTNALRAPLTAAETARRHPDRLDRRRRALLEAWGYPHVMEAFRFHLTLTGRLPEGRAAPVAAVLRRYFAPVLPRPFLIEDLCLFGEDPAGRFHLLHRYALSG